MVSNLSQLIGLFTKYIDKWIEVKNHGTLTGNKGERTRAKLMLNSLYGKFSTKLDVRNKYPYIDEDIVCYLTSDKKEKNGLYIPVRFVYYSICKRKNN